MLNIYKKKALVCPANIFHCCYRPQQLLNVTCTIRACANSGTWNVNIQLQPAATSAKCFCGRRKALADSEGGHVPHTPACSSAYWTLKNNIVKWFRLARKSGAGRVQLGALVSEGCRGPFVKMLWSCRNSWVCRRTEVLSWFFTPPTVYEYISVYRYFVVVSPAISCALSF
jgi:hypothetical protein